MHFPSGPSPATSARWLPFCASIQGSAHLEKGLPCQDAGKFAVLGERGETVVLALSDGAGSAAHAERGSQIVVQHWIEHFQTLLQDHPDPAAVLAESDATDIGLILQRIRETVASEAAVLEVEACEFSATLLGAVVTGNHALVAQVGDGAWVGVLKGVCGCLTWPTNGEYAGQTTFANSEMAADFLQLVHLPEAPSALAGFTDGLERLLLDFQTQQPASGFFLPVFRSLQNDAQLFSAQLEQYLSSESVCARTDDDKSLGILLNVAEKF